MLACPRVGRLVHLPFCYWQAQTPKYQATATPHCVHCSTLRHWRENVLNADNLGSHLTVVGIDGFQVALTKWFFLMAAVLRSRRGGDELGESSI